ncbi:odorant receptor 13a-like [Harpegnathos saltator]|uniref:odorant receptor 13a-like n=1 Tax=Harpegnathos saltator TaxID=610380 RepID=UPI000948F482|nr:odorant receptor 13a-like [Harpegnathos saltator]
MIGTYSNHYYRKTPSASCACLPTSLPRPSGRLLVPVSSSLSLETTRRIAAIMGEPRLTQGDPWFSDFHYATQVSLYLLKPVGIWPLKFENTALGQIAHISTIFLATFLQLFMIIPWIIYIFTAQCDLYEILRTACPLIFSITVFLRYMLLLFHRDEIKSCIDHIAEDWRNATLAEDREIMLVNAKSGRLFGIVSVSFMFGSGLLYCIMPMVAPPIVSTGNVTLRPLPNPCELLILDSQASPVYETVYVMEFLSCFTLFTVFCGISSLTAKFVTHVCGQCEILKYFFDEIVDGSSRNQGTIDQRISTAVMRHLRILKFVTDVDRIMNEICLAEFLNASCNICLLGYYVIMDWKNEESILQISTYFLAFVSITFNIYIFCHIGEMLVEQCQMIGTRCYMIEWYRLPHNKARSLIFSIIMSNYPIELTAGKMLTMTMSSFSNILKTSMAYFNLLREVSS